MKRTGFTLTDLIVAMVLVVVFLGFSLAANVNLDNARNRVKCASNLRQIGQALQAYSNDNHSYPRTKYDPGQADKPAAYTGVDSQDPFGANGPQANDVSAGRFFFSCVPRTSQALSSSVRRAADPR